MADVLDPLSSLQVFGVSLLVFAFLPGLVLRLVVRLYPKGHPRRAELLGELYAMPEWRRPWFVAQQLETALAEGVPSRLAERRQQGTRAPESSSPSPAPERLEAEELPHLLYERMALERELDALRMAWHKRKVGVSIFQARRRVLTDRLAQINRTLHGAGVLRSDSGG